MRRFIYDIWQCADKNGVDLTVGLSMFDADGRNGTKDYLHEDSPAADIHKFYADNLTDYEKHSAAFKDVSNFIHRNYAALVEGYKGRNRENFDKLVSDLTVAEELAEMEAAEQEAEKEAAMEDKTEGAEAAPDVVEDTAAKEV